MKRIKQYIVYAESILLLLTDFYMFMRYANNGRFLCVPIIGVSMLMIFMELFILTNPNKSKQFWNFWVIGVLGTTCLGLLDVEKSFHVFYLVAIFMLIRYKKGRSITYGLGGIVFLFSLIIYIKTQSGYEFFMEWLRTLGMYTSLVVVMLGIKYMIEMNRHLEEMQVHLLEKNVEINNAYEQLKRAYNEIEDYTIMKERSYMSREMHDTVGHTLTTSLVELEICKMLVQDESEVKEKIEHVSDQVRKGLMELRMTVRKLKQDLDWEQEIYAIGERLSKDINIKVRSHIGDLSGIETNTLRCIYRVIQESLTNGIKHGKATAFMIDVDVRDEEILIEIIDNGVGATAFKSGFGLTAMRERVEALQGSIAFESYKDEGFTVRVQLPKKVKESKKDD